MELEWPLSKDSIAEFTETCCTSFHLTGVSCSTDRTTDRAASTRSQQVLLACDFRGLASCTHAARHIVPMAGEASLHVQQARIPARRTITRKLSA